MSPWLNMLLIVLNILLIGCSSLTTVAKTPQPLSTSASTPKTSTPKQFTQAQQLPISAIGITPEGTEIQLEVASTPRQQAMGLMYRPALPDNRGMLFAFPYPLRAKFWMKNVPVNLDMVFMLNGVVQYIAADVPPCDTDPCPTYGPKRGLVNQVIELRTGRAAELNLQPGDRITIRPLPKPITSNN